MPKTNAQIWSLIGVIKTYFVAQKCKKNKLATENEFIFSYLDTLCLIILRFLS